MSEQDINQWIADLRQFRTRSEAISRLVEAGSGAVQPLLRALGQEGQEGAKWAILRCLSDLRAKEAVSYVAPLLEDSHFRSAAYDALVKIAGEDLGPAVQPWLRWARGDSQSAPAAAPMKPEMHMTGLPEARVMELAVENCDAVCRQQGEGRYVVQVKVAAGQTQELDVSFGLKDHEGAPIAVVFTNCGPADPQHYEYALRRNLRMPYGALAIRDGRGGPQFVIFNTLLREDMSPLELRKSITDIAERAAMVRRELEAGTGTNQAREG
jgi:hypothetical protein